MGRRLTRREQEFVLHHRDRLELGQIARRLRVPKAVIQAFLLGRERGEPTASDPRPHGGEGPSAGRPGRRRIGLAAWALGGLGLLAVLTLSPITNNDIWLHLKTGEIILEEGTVPRTERFSFTAAGRPLVPHEWGAALLFALAHGLAGVAGLIAFKALISAGAFAAVAAAAWGMGARPAVLALPLALVMVLVSSRLQVRPHLWSYLLAAVFLWILDGHRRRGGRRIFLLLPLQVAWANLHGGFPLGWLVAGCFLAAEVLTSLRRRGRGGWGRRGARRLAIVTALLPVVCLVNPAGYGLLLFPFRLTGTSSFMSHVFEWLPTFSPAFRWHFMFTEYLAFTGVAALSLLWRLRGPARAVFAAGALLAALGIYLGSTALLGGGLAVVAGGALLGRGAVPPAHALVILALFFLSTRMNRNVTDFALLGLAPAAACLDRSLRRGWRRLDEALRRRPAALTAAAGFLLALLALGITRTGYWFNPTTRRETGLEASVPARAAVDFLEEAGVEGRVLASYNAASYLVWRLHPRVRVFLDSRNEAYGEAIFQEYLTALNDGAAFSRTLDRHSVDAVLLTFRPNPSLVMTVELDSRTDFALVYFDDDSAVYLREDPRHRDVISRRSYVHLSPLSVGRRGIDAETVSQVVEEAQRALGSCEQCLVARGALAEAAFVQGQLHRAETLYRELAEESPDAYLPRVRLGDIYALEGRPELATASYREALRVTPGDEYALSQLESLRESGRLRSVKVLPGAQPVGPETPEHPTAQEP